MDWVTSSGATLTGLDERMAEQYLQYRAGKQFIQRSDCAALKRLLAVLREAGVIAAAVPPPLSPHDQIFETFSLYLQKERGLAPKSIVRHLPVIRLFLREVCPHGVSDLGSVGPEDVTPVMGARILGRRCVGHYAHFFATSIIKG